MKKLLFNAFYQGKDEESVGAGNCASIAIIKAAMYTFGYDVIGFEKELSIYHVTLKNGEKISFNENELLYAKQESSFIIGKHSNETEKKQFSEILDYAHLCFTTICKMAQHNGDFSNRYSKFIIPENFELAVEIINDGTFTPHVYEFLGLEDNASATYRANLRKKVKQSYGMVLWTKSHAMYASEGYFDLYGKKQKFKRRVMSKLPGIIATGIFKLKL
jgi:hypothetical protein